ncbi:MAG: sigma-70 family RNA polymerase sigma factor [Lachnospiraceae bacterium]|nr:sigma-70 family RNA polymerase sigma factor [Lachnospiraceae bacterium]
MQPIEEIYQQYAQTVYKYLLSLTHDRDLAEELTQETFYQAIRSSDRFDESCKVSTWLCAIAKNVLLTYRRKHPQHDNIEDIAIIVESAEKEAIRSADRVKLFQNIHDLQEPYREVVYLRVFGGLSFSEIGQVHGKTENWARVTFYRGKHKLRKEVENDE